MKTIKSTFILLLIASLSFVSCDDEPLEGTFSDELNIDEEAGNGSNGNNVPFTGTFQVNIDGDLWIADNAAANIIDGVTNITGFKGSNGEAVIITLQTDQVGTYQFGPINGEFMLNGGAYNPGGGANAFVTDVNTPNGTVTISSIDTTNKLISGSFSFDALEFVNNTTKVLSGGVFTNVPYSDDLNDSNPGGNSFFAKVDGVEFQEDLVSGFEALGMVSISATKNSSETIGLSFTSGITTGTYSLALPGLGDASALYNYSQTAFGYNGDGSVTITQHDTVNKRIVGTFSYVASTLNPQQGAPNSVNITEGSFDVNYQ